MATFKSLGKFRRQLRAIANTKKAESSLAVLHVGGMKEITEAFKVNVRAQLLAHELVQVKTRVKKKKEAAALGEELASATDSEVAQVVGHSILLFQSNDKEVTGLLTKAGADQDDDGV
jgi:RNA-binding protein YhbY